MQNTDGLLAWHGASWIPVKKGYSSYGRRCAYPHNHLEERKGSPFPLKTKLVITIHLGFESARKGHPLAQKRTASLHLPDLGSSASLATKPTPGTVTPTSAVTAPPEALDTHEPAADWCCGQIPAGGAETRALNSRALPRMRPAHGFSGLFPTVLMP